ncbi:MAG TPA: Fic family protein [Alphaproteobacteria bacterium]|jgi:Fic family protein|nr:Fic family protein [Alphaproteobacteria bacterium]
MYSPKYIISNKILRTIGSIEASKEIIENAPLVPSFEKQFQSDAMVRTIHHGTHIEGNDLTLYQTKKILEGAEVYARARDIQEIINYRNAAVLLDELAVKRGGYDLDMLKDIHRATVDRIVVPEKVGVFRTTEVVIKEEGTDKIIFQPPPFLEVPYLLEDFFAWLNDAEAKEIHPILRAGIAHYILVAIHPFVEGNGRTIRAFASLILMREGYNIKKFFSLEEHFDDDPAAYYEALGEVDRQSPNLGSRELTPWLEYFTNVVALELEKVKERVRRLSVDSRLKVKFGEQVALNERQMRLIEYISDQGSGGMAGLKKVLPMVSEDTVLRELRDLLSKGILKKSGSTKASKYVIANK